MFIPNIETHTKSGIAVDLRFVIHWAFEDTTTFEWNKWKELRKLFNCCLTDEIDEKRRSQIYKEWLSYTTIESNKELPILDRCEGGLGGDNNIKNKQIRGIFQNPQPFPNNEKEIIFNVYNADEDDEWSFEELKDIINAFERFCTDFIHPDDPVEGFIVIKDNEKV